MMPFLKFIHTKFIAPGRVRRLTELLVPYLKDCSSILDLGAGNGNIAKNIKEKTGVTVVGVDMIARPNTPIPIRRYDGRRLPFEDNSFDCVMLVDVLHHDPDMGAVIAEAKRVATKYILIKDHYWNTKLDLLLLKICDWIGNAPYGVPVPYNFRKMAEWEKLFKEKKLFVETSRKIPGFHWTKHVVFKLKK